MRALFIISLLVTSAATIGCSMDLAKKAQNSSATTGSDGSEVYTGDPSSDSKMMAALQLANDVADQQDTTVAAMSPTDVDQAVTDLSAKLMQNLDTNKDGHITADELKQALSAAESSFRSHFPDITGILNVTVVIGAIKNHITVHQAKHKDHPDTDFKSVCDRFQHEINAQTSGALERSSMFDRILARCQGIDVPQDAPMKDYHGEVCAKFKEIAAGASTGSLASQSQIAISQTSSTTNGASASANASVSISSSASSGSSSANASPTANIGNTIKLPPNLPPIPGLTAPAPSQDPANLSEIMNRIAARQCDDPAKPSAN